jgi:hypothetical protein
MVVAGAVHEDPTQPRGGPLGVPEPGQLLLGRQERVLRHVLGHLGAGDDDGQPVQVGKMKIDQVIEGFTIALACSRDQIQRVLPRARRSRRPVDANRSVDLNGAARRLSLSTPVVPLQIGATAQISLT